MKGSYKNILNHSPCPDEKMLEKYTEGKLSAKDKYEIEKHLLDCEMCSDLVEGLQLAMQSNTDITSIVANINTDIDNLSGGEFKTKKVIPLWLRYAAVIALLIGIGFLVREFMFYGKFRTELAINKDQSAIEIEKSPNAPVSEKATGKETIEDITSGVIEEEKLGESSPGDQYGGIPKTPGKAKEKQGETDRVEGASASGYTSKQSKVDKNVQERMAISRSKQEPLEMIVEEPQEIITIVDDETASGSGKTTAKRATETIHAKDIITVECEEEATKALDQNKSKNNWRLFGKKNKKVAAEAAKETAPAAGFFVGDNENIQDLYQDQRYQEIIDIYAQQENLARKHYYYLGLSYYYTHIFDKAILYFNRAIQNNEDDTTLSSRYYKALSLKKKNNQDKAIRILKELQEIDHPISIKAKKMLTEF